MHTLCKIFGHRYTKRIESKSIFYADNMWCCRCKKWSADHPGEWFEKYGNGILPDTIGWWRASIYFPTRRVINFFMFWKDRPPF